MYHVIDGLLEPSAARALGAQLTALPANQWEAGGVGSGEQASAVKHNLQLSRNHQLSKQVSTSVMRALDASPQFLSLALPRRVFPPRVNRYDPQHPAFGWHVDGAVRLIPPDGQAMRTDLSCTVALTDPDAYHGGVLQIQDGHALHQIKLQAGSAVLYPASTLHQVTPVTRGTRIATFFWVESLVANDTDRRILSTLDEQVTRLRQRHGECSETTALTGVYHHLLRRWAVA